MRQMTVQGYAFLKKEEGERLQSYDDATGKAVGPNDPCYGTLTIGIGHTGPDVFKGQIITPEQSQELFDKDTDWAEACVENALVSSERRPNDNQFDALVSLCFNIGESAFKSSSVVRMWKAGDYKAAGNSISLWTKWMNPETGRKEDHPVLIARRARETAVFFTPVSLPVTRPTPQAVEDPGKARSSPTLKAAAAVAIPAAGVLVENVNPTIEAIQATATTISQATGTMAALKLALSSLANGHVLTVLMLTVTLGAIAYIAARVFGRIRRGEVSAT